MDVSCIVLAKNEAEVLHNCLKSLQSLNSSEIILIDDQSSDATVEIAKKYQAKIFDHQIKSFAEARNFAAEKAAGTWLLYIDADERLSPELAAEINQVLKQQVAKFSAYELIRINYYLGKRWPKTERIVRFIIKEALENWIGDVHETPQINGKIGQLSGRLLHDTHRNLNEMISNTLKWSQIEAKLRLDQNHPPVVWWRLPRVMLPTFWDYYIKQGGWRVGTVGLIESIYQAFSIFITYARLWEMQQRKSWKM